MTQAEGPARADEAGFANSRSDGPKDLSDDEIGFLFFLGLSDRRACWAPRGVGLSDGLNGWAVADPNGISWWRDASLAVSLTVSTWIWTREAGPGSVTTWCRSGRLRSRAARRPAAG